MIGWYLAAAAVLADVAIQIEPGKPQTPQAEQFLRDAGLGARLQPYRSRPRANKHLPEIVGRAFRADPLSAQRKLRAAFLGNAPIPQAVIDWADRRLVGVSAGRKVLLWVRYGAHHPTRNTIYPELVQLAQRALAANFVPILVGDAIRDGELSGAVDMTLFWKEPIFQGTDMRLAQLPFFEHLKAAHRCICNMPETAEKSGMTGGNAKVRRRRHGHEDPHCRRCPHRREACVAGLPVVLTTRNVENKVAWFQNPDTAGGCRCDAISRSRDPQGHC